MSAQVCLPPLERVEVDFLAPSHPRWIVSACDDLVWFIGSAAAGYLFWALWRYSQIPLAWLVAAWAVIFDETHGYATWSRTVLDSEERARRVGQSKSGLLRRFCFSLRFPV